MRKSILTITVAATIGFGGVFSSEIVHADSLQSLKQDKAGIQDERASVKDNLSDAEKDIASVLTDIEEINQEIERTEKALNDNQEKMGQTEEEIDEANQKIDDLQSEVDVLKSNIEERMNILQERARSYQEKGGDINYMEVIFGAKSFGEFISRLAIVNKITESDATLVKEQEADKEKLVSKQDNVETKLKELEDMKVDLADVENVILAQQDANAEKKQNLNKKKTNLRKMVAKLEVKDTRLAALENSVSQDIAAANQPPANNLTTLGSSSSNNSSSAQSGKSSNSSKSANTNITKPAPSSSKSGAISAAISLGKQFIGRSSYVYAAKDPKHGRFDCSGFVSWALESGGYGSVPRSTSGLRNIGTKIPASQMQAGDLVFFNTIGVDRHVGIYLGGGKFLGSQSSTGVDIADMTTGYWKGTFKGHVRRLN